MERFQRFFTEPQMPVIANRAVAIAPGSNTEPVKKNRC